MVGGGLLFFFGCMFIAIGFIVLGGGLLAGGEPGWEWIGSFFVLLGYAWAWAGRAAYKAEAARYGYPDDEPWRTCTKRPDE